MLYTSLIVSNYPFKQKERKTRKRKKKRDTEGT